MDSADWLFIVLLTLGVVLGVCATVSERRAENAFYDRLFNDPEFAKRYHEETKHDNWEDRGYFDGR